MNIPKAIEILEYNLERMGITTMPDTCKALQLGIEALEFIDKMRAEGCTFFTNPLPGETKD